MESKTVHTMPEENSETSPSTPQESSPPPNLLIVDDTPSVAGMLRVLLTRHGYTCEMASNADEAEEKLKENKFELLLVDVNMPPGRSGLELVKDVSAEYPTVATIMISGMDDPIIGKTALEIGAFGYILKPFNNTELLINVENALARRKLRMRDKDNKAQLEKAVMERTKELLHTINRLELIQAEVKSSQEETIHRLAKAAEFRDNETAQHIARMSRYCEVLAQKAGLDDERCELIRAASPMHDIGKIGTEDRILLKKGKHTEEEREIMKQHAEIGYRILSGSKSDLLILAANIALTHHERYDGGGYPNGLSGESIPLEGRITTIADVFDALTSKRVYKIAFPLDQAIKMMRDEKGKHFDPYLLDLFFDALPEIMEIKDQYSDS